MPVWGDRAKRIGFDVGKVGGDGERDPPGNILKIKGNIRVLDDEIPNFRIPVILVRQIRTENSRRRTFRAMFSNTITTYSDQVAIA